MEIVAKIPLPLNSGVLVERIERALSEYGMFVQRLYVSSGIVHMEAVDPLVSIEDPYVFQRGTLEGLADDIYGILEREEEIAEDRDLLSDDSFYAKYW